MDSPSVIQKELDSSGSGNSTEESRFALDVVVVYCFCVFTTIALVLVELLVFSFHYGAVRPFWTYILGGCNVILIILSVLRGTTHLASVQWRSSKNQQKINTASMILVWSLFGVFVCCFNIFPFQTQSYYSPLLLFIGGFGVGMCSTMTIVAGVYLFFGKALFKEDSNS